MHDRQMMRVAVAVFVAAALIGGAGLALVDSPAAAFRGRPMMGQSDFDALIQQFSAQQLMQGRQIFRFDTFGDEAFWGGQLMLHQAIEGSAHGGVGPGVSPATALSVGLKVDADALPQTVLQQLTQGRLNLDDPATTLVLLQHNAVIGVTGIFNADGTLRTMGIQCALCHSTVDNSVTTGVGKRLDGWANRDLNIGAIVALAPNLQPIAQLLNTDVATVKTVLESWGPGKFDAELFLDGKAFRPDGKSAATLIPPAFGLRGVNLHTWTGWGSIPYWNAFVAILEMHGKGTFFDPRLDNAAQFPIAAAHGFGHVTAPDSDLITTKLPPLHYYQLSIPAPAPPAGSFDEAAADRGDDLFSGKAKCASCHADEFWTEPGWNMHTGAEIGIDDFQADRAPDHRYRTAPLKGLWTHTKGGFYHDGRFATLLDVVNHYNDFFALGLSDAEKRDVVEYLKSLADEVPTSVRNARTLNGQPAGDNVSEDAVRSAPAGGLSVWPLPARRGEVVNVAFLSPTRLAAPAPSDLRVELYDVRGRRVAEIPGVAAEHGMITVSWDGRDARGATAAAGVYFVRASARSVGFQAERRILVR